MTKILILDNYDSFTYNLFHQVKELCTHEVTVCKNDEISVEAVNGYDWIILSPGPGLPKDAGIMPQLISTYSSSKKILGVCLGHQAIAEAFGGELINTEVFHGVSAPVYYNDEAEMFRGLTNPFEAGRYHSWMVSERNFPLELEVTARDEKDNIMALSHRTFAVTGVQFHPESIMTTEGRKILLNWIKTPEKKQV